MLPLPLLSLELVVTMVDTVFATTWVVLVVAVNSLVEVIGEVSVVERHMSV